MLSFGISVLVLCVATLILLFTKEGFFDVPDAYKASVASGTTKFNPLTSTLNLLNPAVPIDPIGSKDMEAAIIGYNPLPTDTTYDLKMETVYDIPSQSPAMFEAAKACEAADKTCNAFNDPTFAANCGMSFDTQGSDSVGRVFTGGLYIMPDERKKQLARAATVEQTGSEPYDPVKVYQPTLGRARPGTFSLNKDSCVVVKEKVDCAAKQTFKTPNCTQCYTSQQFSRVGPKTGRLPSTLHLYGVGTVTVSGNRIGVSQQPLSESAPANITLPEASEGITFTIRVTGAGAPYLAGYLEGPTARGTFKVDLKTMVKTDTVTNAKPRITGTKTVGGFRCTTLGLGSGKKEMNLACLMPYTFINGFDGDSLACDNGPIITLEESAVHLESDPCYGKANSPGNYKLECLQSRWIDLGGTPQGTGYPKDTAAANLIQRDSAGNPLDIDTIVDTLSVRSAQAQTGQNASGVSLSIPDWNAQSMFMTGVPITNPCDGPNNAMGPVSKDCAVYLYQNKGQGSRVGSTYTLPASQVASAKERFTDVLDAALQTSVAEGYLDADAPPPPAVTYNQPEGTASPTTAGGIALAQSLGGVAAVQQTYNAINQNANNNAVSNDARAADIEKGYGIKVQPITTNRSDFDVRIGANQETNTYDDMKAVCEKKGMRLCTSNEICDMKTRQIANPELTSEFQVDNWIAVGDTQNEWLTLNRYDGRYCKTHTEVTQTETNGKGYLPSWGSQRNPSGWERLAKCCPKGGDTLMARYVRIQYSRVDYLNLAQIQIFATESEGSQIPLTAGQVSKSSGYIGDMFPNQHFVNGTAHTFVHTSGAEVPWIEVDLGYLSTIYKVILTNRKDCCQGRVLGTNLLLLDSARKPLYHSDPIQSVNATYTWFPPKAGVYADYKGDAPVGDNAGYRSLGCWGDTGDRAMPIIEGTDPRLTGNYQERADAINKCYEVAKERGMKIFSVQHQGHCQADSTLDKYKKYGPSRACANGKGGPWANDVYLIGDNEGPTETKKFYSDNGTTTCERYCSGVDGVSWNNEGAGWNGASCAGVEGGIADCYSRFSFQPGVTNCICKKKDSGWRPGGWLNQ